MTVFFFTDIEGSTRLWDEHTDEMADVIRSHDAILREEVAASGGKITKHTGDGVTAAFEAGDPVGCALATQQHFSRANWGTVGDLRIRIGLHAGEAQLVSGDYFGPPVNCTARVMSVAWGGQIVLTPVVLAVAPLPAQAALRDLGEHLLKDVSAPQRIYQLDHPALLRQDFPPLRSLSGAAISRYADERGIQLRALSPAALAAFLVAAALLPTLQGDLAPTSPGLANNLGVLQDLGATSLQAFLADSAARLRGAQSAGIDDEGVGRRLEAELLGCWEAGGQTALALRADASRLLQAVGGVAAAMAVGSADVRSVLAGALMALGNSFVEFRWMLGNVQQTLADLRARQTEQLALQREQLDLQRQQLAKTDLILHLQQAPGTGLPPSEATAAPCERIRSAMPSALEEPQIAPAPPAGTNLRLPAFLTKVRERRESLRPAFVAREGELTRLHELLHQALKGEGRVAFVTGGAGRGKTALMAEFARRVQADHPDVLVVMGSCDAYSGVGDPYHPFRDCMAMLTGDVEGRYAAGTITGEHARRLWRVLPRVGQRLMDDGPELIGIFVPGRDLLARARAAAPGGMVWQDDLARLVSRSELVPTWLEQSHLFEQYANVVCGISSEAPVLLVLDDLQWADSGSVGLLFHLGRHIEDSRLLIVCAYRPDEVALGRDDGPHPLDSVLSEFKRRFGDVWVDLIEADGREGPRFVSELLDTEPNRLGDDFRSAVANRTGGHPLFTIELLRDMQELGGLVKDDAGRWVEGLNLEWNVLPARVEGAIERRIGRLDAELRDLLSVASVEGEGFTAQVVARVQQAGERQVLRALSQQLDRRHHLVREQGEVRIDHKRLSRYQFANALFHRYVHTSLGAGERRVLHGEVGEALEELYAGHTDLVPLQLARHFEQAGDARRAIGYYLQAGNQARAAYADHEAIAHIQRGLALVETLPPTHERDRQELELQLALGVPVVHSEGHAANEVRAVYSRAHDLAEQVGSGPERMEALVGLRRFHFIRGDLPAALKIDEQLLALANGIEDRVHRSMAVALHGETLYWAGAFARSRDLVDGGLEQLRTYHDRSWAVPYGNDPWAFSYVLKSLSLWHLGYPEEALECEQNGLEIARELAHPFTTACSHFFATYHHLLRREAQPAQDLAEVVAHVSAERGFDMFSAWGAFFQGWALAGPDQLVLGLAQMERSFADWQATGERLNKPVILAALGEAYGRLSRADEGLRCVDKGLELVHHTGEGCWEAELRRLHGELLAQQGKDAAAEASFRQAIDVAQAQGARSWELRAATSLGRLWHTQGRRDEARELVLGIYSWFTEGFDTADLRDARELLEALG
jgi:class 3 adenylate cyclase/tetratricopeptide (TPR) repeat protein